MAWCSIKRSIAAPNTADLVAASEGVGLEVNAEKTGDQNAGQNRNIKKDIKSFGRFQIFGNNINASKFHSGRN